MTTQTTTSLDNLVQSYTRNNRITSKETKNPFYVFGNAMGMETRRHATQFVIDNLIAGLTPCEFITLTAVQNRTVFYGKYAECIPQKHILKGLGVGAEYGEQNGYPISRKSLSTCLKSLEQKGRIISYQSRHFNTWPKFYGVNFMYNQERSPLAFECFTAFWEALIRHGVSPSLSQWLTDNLNGEYGNYMGNELYRLKARTSCPDELEAYDLRNLGI